jgi:hypothetical protein
MGIVIEAETPAVAAFVREVAVVELLTDLSHSGTEPDFL